MLVGVSPQCPCSTSWLQPREGGLQRNAYGGKQHISKFVLWSSRRCSTSLSTFSRPLSGHPPGGGSGRKGIGRFVCQNVEEPASTYAWPDDQKPRICILGGGFGGLYTALRLDSLIWTNDKKPQANISGLQLVSIEDDFIFLMDQIDSDPAPTRGKQHISKFVLWSSRRCSTSLSTFSRPLSGHPPGGGSGRKGIGRFVCQNVEEPASTYAWPDDQKPRICILGGGFGGLYTALRLDSLIWTNDKKPQVLLVDQSEHFVFKPLLYELLSGEANPWEIAPTFKDLLRNTSVQFLQDKVKLLQPSDHLSKEDIKRLNAGGSVHLESGVIVEYDWLVLALGAEAKLDAVPGASELAMPFSTLEDAIRVDETLRELERERFTKKSSPIQVAIVGCGYSGVELAATISERLQDKGNVQAINVATTICPTAPSGNREAALKVLSSRNIQFFLGYYVSCIRASFSKPVSESCDVVNEDETAAALGSKFQRIVLELQAAERGLDRKVLEADLVLWTVGSKPLAAEVGAQMHVIPFNGRGQAETDETLRIKGHPRIFAIGDSATLRDSSGRLLPATAQVAFQQADFTGWNLWAAINDRPLLPFRFQNLGEMMTLGKNDTAVSPSFAGGVTLDGPVGHAARKLAYLWRMPTDEHRLKVGLSWLAKSTIDSIATLQSTLIEVLSGSKT